MTILENIISKMGYNPVNAPIEELEGDSWNIDDNEEPNPFSVLNDEELDYVIEERLKFLRSLKDK